MGSLVNRRHLKSSSLPSPSPPPPLPCPSLSSPPPPPPPPLPCPFLSSPPPPLSTSPPSALQPIPSSPPPPPPTALPPPPPSSAPPPSLPPVNTEPYNYTSPPPPPPTIRSPPPSTPPPLSTLPPPPVPTTPPPLPSVSAPPPVEPPVYPYRTTSRPGAVSPSNNSSSHNIVISREATAAIAVVAGLVTLSFVGAAFWFVKRRRRPKVEDPTVGSQLSGSRDMTPNRNGKENAPTDDEAESSQRNIHDKNADIPLPPDPSLQPVLQTSGQRTFNAGHPETTKQVPKVISQEKHSQFAPEISEKVPYDRLRKIADKQLQDMMNKAYKAATKSFGDSMLELKAREIAPSPYDWIKLRNWTGLVNHCCNGAFTNRSHRNALNSTLASGSGAMTSFEQEKSEPRYSDELEQPIHMNKKTGEYISKRAHESNKRAMMQKYGEDKGTGPNYDDDVGYSTGIDDQNAHGDNYDLGKTRGMIRSSGSSSAPHLTKEYIDMISSRVLDRINVAFRVAQGGSGSQQVSIPAPQDDKDHDGDDDEGQWSNVGGDGTA